MGSVNMEESQREVSVLDGSLELMTDNQLRQSQDHVASPADSSTTTQELERLPSPDVVDTTVLAESQSTMYQSEYFAPTQPPAQAMQASWAASETTMPSPSLQDEGRDVVADVDHDGLDIRAGDDNISWTSRRSRQVENAGDIRADSEDQSPSASLFMSAQRSESPSTPLATSTVLGERRRRPVSPYDRSYRSPGSWPLLEDPSLRQRPRPSPGSWPALDQSHQSFHYALGAQETDAEAPASSQPLVQANLPQGPMPLINPEHQYEHDISDAVVPQDLMESRVFSHDEAESIYMSVLSDEPVDRHEHVMPGAWTSSIGIDNSRALPAQRRIAPRVEEPGLRTSRLLPPISTEVAHMSRSIGFTQVASPRPGSASSAHSPRDVDPPPDRNTQQLVRVDNVTIRLPSGSTPSAPHVPPSQPSATPTYSRTSPAGMPGTFSVYSDRSASHRRRVSSTYSEVEESVTVTNVAPTTAFDLPIIAVCIGMMDAQTDPNCAEMLYKIGSTMQLHMLKLADDPDNAVPKNASVALTQRSRLQVSLESVRVDLHENLKAQMDEASDIQPALLSARLGRLRIDTGGDRHEVNLGKLRLSIGGTPLVGFSDSSMDQAASVLVKDDLRVAVATGKSTVQGRSVAEVDVQLRVLDLAVDLAAIDAAFTPFGGLSGVLELGSTIISDHSPLASPSSSMKAPRVRFQDDTLAPNVSTEIKANVRLAGLSLSLRGVDSAISTSASTTKLLYREKLTSVRFTQVRFQGLPQTSDANVFAEMAMDDVRLDYLFTPPDAELERLISLVTPTKDKYDNDNDILLDTVMRQRRKAACLKITLNDIKVKVVDWEFVNSLESLAAEISRFSVVTKYLPEDDRPGLLTMLWIKRLEAHLPVNERFGLMKAVVHDIHCAQVGLPWLLAVAVSRIRVERSDGQQVVHQFLPLTGVDDHPMVMARMVGDEAEPMIKVKLFNTCFEYSVATLVGLIGVDEPESAERLVVEMVSSVAHIASSGRAGDQSPTKSEANDKKTQVVLLLHHSAIGFIPTMAASKGIVVLTDGVLSTTVPPGESASGSVRLREAGLFITDAVRTDDQTLLGSRRNPAQNTKVSRSVLAYLSRQSFVSIGSLSSASVDVRASTKPAIGHTTVEVDVRNEFLLLETCADSTQTLFALLGGLSPRTKPSNEVKYLTQPTTLEDMISSFSGEAVSAPQKSASTLFDIEKSGISETSSLNASLSASEPDDLLVQSEMTSSLYGPISGILNTDNADEEKADEDSTDIAESLLEDDPFEMAEVPENGAMGDAALLRSLRKQCQPASSEQTVQLDDYEIEDLGFNPLGPEHRALGSRHRFNAPTSRKVYDANKALLEHLPFRLRLRDVNFEWHLHDGYDWQDTRDGISAAVEKLEQRAEQRIARRRQQRDDLEDDNSVIGDCMFNSVYIAIPSNVNEIPDIRRGINRNIDDMVSESESVPASAMSRPTTYSAGGRPVRQRQRKTLKLERSRHHKISFELKGVSADVLVFPPETGEVQSSIDVRLKNFEIYDLVPTSTWKKFLTRMPSDGTRQLFLPMVHINLLNVLTKPSLSMSEIVMHVAVQPLRLHVDQDALDFITRFFEFKDSNAPPPTPPNEQPFLQRIEVETVDLQLDYKPKKIDYGSLRSGHTSEFMNFVILDQANIRLKHVIIYGLQGFDPLHKTLNDIWMPDVTRNQLPTVLAGLAPVRSLVNIGTGVRDVVAIPIREYKKDGRIVRSIQKGAFHFGKTTASELARLGAKVAIGTQNLLTGAEGLLSPASASYPGRRGSPIEDWDGEEEATDRETRAYSAYADQPLNVFAGLKSARRHLEHDLLTARDAFIAVQGEVLESSGPASAAAAVARHAPIVILRPVIGVSRAVGTALLGAGNQVDRGGIKRMDDKYKRR
ncbi:autophagy-related protein 2 [Oleoguttula sp. CCFEE 5521]